MGHYYSEMACSDCGSIRCDCWKKNHKLLIKEIEEVIAKNPIKIKDIKKNTILTLYKELLRESNIEKGTTINTHLWLINEKYSSLFNPFIYKKDSDFTSFELDKNTEMIILNNKAKFEFLKRYIPLKYFEIKK